MKKSRLLGAVCACLAVVSFSVNANPTEADWLSAGDGLITYDANTGLEWLDLSLTANMSYNDVSAQLGVGGNFEGWAYAAGDDIATLWDSFGGGVYDGWSTATNGLFDVVAPLMGDLYCQSNGCPTGNGYSTLITGDLATSGVYVAWMFDLASDTQTITQDYFRSGPGFEDAGLDSRDPIMASALVRTSPVPVPAAVWLFGSGLLGLVGVARRKVRT